MKTTRMELLNSNFSDADPVENLPFSYEKLKEWWNIFWYWFDSVTRDGYWCWLPAESWLGCQIISPRMWKFLNIDHKIAG